MGRTIACLLVVFLAARTARGTSIPASADVLELNEWSFQRVTAGGSNTVYFVEFYAADCRACRRVAHEWDLVAGSVAVHVPRDVTVARLNCEEAGRLCIGLGVQHTPTFKVYHEGQDVYTYRADFYLAELMIPFIRKFSADIRGIELPSVAPLTAA